MLQTTDGDTAIELGNKQLLGIFFVVVILLGVAFAGGYKVGQGSKKISAAATGVDSASNTGTGQTHAVGPDAAATSATAEETPAPAAPIKSTPADDSQTLLGKPHAKSVKTTPIDTEAAGPPPTSSSAHELFTPQPGQTFLQVAAVGKDEAEGISDVLRKRGFHAHAVQKPGSQKLYRVIIGPVRDAADLNSTRGQLRNTGFREIIVQKY